MSRMPEEYSTGEHRPSSTGSKLRITLEEFFSGHEFADLEQEIR